MDQAAIQPARANSAPPTHATTAAAAHTTGTAPAHTPTVAHTEPPTQGFWTDTMKPAVFWNAASAVATSAAILAAFFIPWLAERRQQRVRTRFALRMLRPVFDEAVQLTNEAEVIYANCQDLVANIGEIDRATFTSDKNMIVGSNTWRSGPHGMESVYIAVPRKETIDRIRQFAMYELPSYVENRSWLMGLEPDDAGALQNSFSEALLNLRNCRQSIEGWPDIAGIVSKKNVEGILLYVLRTREVSNIAARILARLLKQPIPDEVNDAE